MFRLLRLLPFLLTATMGFAVASCDRGSDADNAKPLPPPLVEVAKAKIESRDVHKRFSGYTQPWEAHGVGFLIGGRVSSMLVSAGDRVTQGQLIATLEPEDYALVKRLADVQVSAIKPNYERVDSLVRDQALPEAKLDELRGMYHAAVTQKEQAQRQLQYTRLKAPIDGTVMERRTSVGQVIGAGMPAVVILNMDRVKVSFGVTQSELSLFKIGDDVSVDVPGLASPLKGNIHHIALVPDLKARTYDVEVAIDNADGVLRAGMLAHMLRTRQAETGYFIPIMAVRHDHDHSPVLYLVDPSANKVIERKVELGELFGTDVVIKSGLAEKDLVIVEGQGFVAPGDEVRVK